MTEFADVLQQALAPGYKLERELTGGGMSRVFVATDVSLGRKVVVKVLPPELAAGVNHERFRREIQVAAQLQHPHIVPLLSAGEQGTLIWYTMPFINGHSLRELLAKGEQQPVKDVVRTMRDVAEALDYAHGLGVIHRDIKPGNVLLMGSHALVTDFGVAKAISAAMPTSGFTSAGMAIGTPAYMAPEQIAADPAADHRMDLYALGLLGYELLTGHVPFKEDSPQKTMAAQLTRDPQPVDEARQDVPPALAMLVRKLLSKLPEDRPQVASEVVAALDEIALTSGQHLAPLRAVRKPSVGRTLLVAAAGIAVIATAWFAGEQRGNEAGTAAVRDSLAIADSMEVVASAAALLTREDSMAIARAVSERLKQRAVPSATPTGRPAAGAATAATLESEAARLSAIADSIRLVVQRDVLDSLVQMRAMGIPGGVRITEMGRELSMATDAQVSAIRNEGRGEPRGGPPRRVVVAPPRPSRSRPEMDGIAGALVDSLRLRIDAHPHYISVPGDSVASALAESRTINGVQERLSSDIIVSVSLIPVKDSVVRLITVRDLVGPDGFNMRTIASPVSAKDPTAGLTELVPKVVAQMLEMERSGFRFVNRGPNPREGQPPPGGAPPPPPRTPPSTTTPAGVKIP